MDMREWLVLYMLFFIKSNLAPLDTLNTIRFCFVS